METPKIFESEYHFCLIMWEHEPVTTVELVKLCQEQLGWKRTTTYTVLKRLSDGGLFRNEGGIVTALISKEDFYAIRSEMVVRESFGGSLPAFIAAFTARQELSEDEIAEITAIIDKMKGNK
mgnify:CR=1 FL=1